MGVGCEICGKKDNLLRCGGCKSVCYCSKEHQKDHWKAHKPTCKKLQQQQQQPAQESENEEYNRGKEEVEDKEDEEFRQQREAMEHLRNTEVVGLCGIHSPHDLSGQAHALNNMAGKHRIDVPISWYELTDLDEEFIELTADESLVNGIIIKKGSSKMKTEAKLGVGIQARGKVQIGISTAHFSGDPNYEYVIKEKTLIGHYIEALPGSRVDAFCVIHGPLRYRSVFFGEGGGVHYNGSAFEHTSPHYKEVCIEALVFKREQDRVQEIDNEDSNSSSSSASSSSPSRAKEQLTPSSSSSSAASASSSSSTLIPIPSPASSNNIEYTDLD